MLTPRPQQNPRGRSSERRACLTVHADAGEHSDRLGANLDADVRRDWVLFPSRRHRPRERHDAVRCPFLIFCSTTGRISRRTLRRKAGAGHGVARDRALSVDWMRLVTKKAPMVAGREFSR